MNILIDTHIFLWAVLKLSKRQQTELLNTENNVYVSSLSIAEIMIKSSLGKLNVPFDPVKAAEDSGFLLVDFAAEDALLLKELPFYHKDPFDRMLIVQAIANRYVVMTNDAFFDSYVKEGLRVLK